MYRCKRPMRSMLRKEAPVPRCGRHGRQTGTTFRRYDHAQEAAVTQLDHKESLRHEERRVFRIMREFVDAFETLAKVGPAVSMFGSARTRPNDPAYHRAVSCAAKRVEKNFAVITVGSPSLTGRMCRTGCRPPPSTTRPAASPGRTHRRSRRARCPDRRYPQR